MARHILQYTIKEGKTSLSGEELSFRFLHIDGRIHVLEEQLVSWQAAVAELQGHGLERINNVMQPLLDQAQANIDATAAELAGLQAQWADIVAGWEAMGGTVDALAIDVDTLDAGLTSLDGRVDQLENDLALYVPLSAFLAEHDAAGNHTTFSQPIRATEQAAQPAQPAAGVGGLDWYDDGGVPVVGAWDGDGNFVELTRGGVLMAANPTIQYGSMNISTGANNSDSFNTATIDPVTPNKTLVLLTMSAYSSRDTISSLGAVLSIAVSLIDATTVQGAICKNGQTTESFTASVSFAVIDFSPSE